jgi:asparagine synthase (glutamine-hydrolysing)
MCGIAGILRTNDRPLPAPLVIRRMIASLGHRGPNDAGEYLDDDVQLSVVRLAIIDLKGGHQPVATGDGRIVSVYNGEIYNYHEIRRALADAGHSLPNECDSAVLPFLYEEQGVECLRALRGMFAFAVWDARERRLLLARDRLGIKPLYWAQTADYLLFASEIKAIVASGLVEAQVDRDSLDDIFSLSYPCPPRTMFRGIWDLEPAHFATVRAGTPLERTQRYWRIPFPHRGEHRREKPADLETEFREALTRKVYDHLQADVRVGTYLSGGLDSAAISALVSEVTGDPPVTFSIGFSTAEHDERDFAMKMVGELASENHSIVCDETTAERFPEMIWHTELPLQFPLALPLMQLAATARGAGFPVVLTGEGVDEMMGGYDCFRGQKMRRVFDRPGLRSLRPYFYRQLYKWLRMPDGAVEKMLEVQQRPIEAVQGEFSGVYPAWYDNWQIMDVDRDLLLSPDGRDVRAVDHAPSEYAALVREDIQALDPLDAQLAVEMETRLPAWMLLIGDRASMAHGVEARVPFLDDEIVEFVARVPPSLKMKGFTEKALLRGAMKGRLPDAIRRRQKRPFYTPLKEWFFSESAPDYVDELLSERAVRDAGLFAPEVVKKLRQDLALVPHAHLMRFQLEWVLIQVLGAQLIDHLFISNFGPAAQPVSSLFPRSLVRS